MNEMRTYFILITGVFFFFCKKSYGSSILAVVTSPYFSHQATYRPIWRELAKRGHKITLLTTDLMESNENITQIDYHEMYDVFEKLGVKEMFVKNFSIFNLIDKLVDSAHDINAYQLSHPGLKHLMENPTEFDLMMMELLPPWTALSCIFKIPFIQMTTMDGNPYSHAASGNAMHPAIYPVTELGFELPLSFWQRLLSTGFMVWLEFLTFFVVPKMFENSVRTFISEDCPPLKKLETKTSLFFVNSNPIFFPTRAITPTTINLGGGLHLTEAKPLPSDLRTFLDASKDGCIYFSLGTTVNSNALTPEVIEIFKKVFQKIAPMKVLWKFENDTLPSRSENVEIRKWLPQQDVLRHPNVKIFITQGGLQSMEEAVEYAVPMIGIPFYGDQMNNVNKMVTKQFGVELNIKTLDEESLTKAIHELLDNPIYRKNIQKYSNIQRDRPMSALETAVWWTEYVLRHGGTEHLESPSADIPLYQYFFLDIFAFVSVLSVLIFLILFKSFKLTHKLSRQIWKYLKSEQVKWKKT